MECEKVFGGYFELEARKGTEYWSDSALALNTGRNCLRQIIRSSKIKRLYVPKYTCPVVWEAVKAEGCESVYYSVDNYLKPVEKIGADEWMLYTNYLGVCSENVEELSKKNHRLIVDCSQSFFSTNMGVATFNSARKFFGVPDGAYLLSNVVYDDLLEQDISFDRASHLLKRIELGSQAGIDDFHKNEEQLCSENIKAMSALTHHILKGIDYKAVKQIRRANWSVLDSMLGSINEWIGRIGAKDVPMAYPLVIKNDSLRSKLIKNKVFVPTFWNGQKDSEYGRYLEHYLFPLPIDQRYNEEDMQFIATLIKNII